MVEIERVRKKAAADFHDELGHKLTKISLFSELLERSLQNLRPSEVEYLQRIGDLSSSLYHGMRDFLWTLDPEKDSLFEVAIRLKDFGDEFFDQSGIHKAVHAQRRATDFATVGKCNFSDLSRSHRNMGRGEAAMEHDLRYDRADEFMEIVLGHWDSWDDDAIVADKVNNVYAHPDKVRRIDYQGQFLSSRGPFTVPRSPQGHPVVMQAGISGRGQVAGVVWSIRCISEFPVPGSNAKIIFVEEDGIAVADVNRVAHATGIKNPTVPLGNPAHRTFLKFNLARAHAHTPLQK